MKLRHPLKALQCLILLLAFFAALNGVLDVPIHKLGMEKVAAANQTYLKQSMDKAVSGFLILSGIKTGLAVVEGSEVGIGFNLQIGDIVQSVYDYVDIAWKTALAGGTVILITRLLLQAVDLIDHWFLALTFGFGLLVVLARWIFPSWVRANRLMKDATFFLVVCTVVFYFVFPFSIAGAAFISQKITGPLIDESQRSFEGIKDEFSAESINRQIFSSDSAGEESSIAGFIFKGKMAGIKEAIKVQADYFKDKSRNIAIWTLQLIAGYLFDSIIFPVTFFIFLFVIAKGALLYLFEDRRQQAFSDDIRAVLSELQRMKPERAPRTASRLRSDRRRRLHG
ncbi:MAG: hypothetical protein PVG81_14425 [Desulfobacterales bacterium]|jgi:hypothetical protein